MEYRIQIASDVIRDGLGLELINATNQVCAEVFRGDSDNTLKISLFAEDLPFVQVENLVLIARKELVRYEDGTPLPSAIPLQSSYTEAFRQSIPWQRCAARL